jgi:glycine/D-amino acid oxidase-like deaminating enzyme
MELRMAAADETPRAYLPLPDERVMRRRIAVIGGGLMGTATAYAAARLGGAAVTVDLYEADQIGHEGGASIDSTRLFRHAYGEWSHYTRWAAQAFPLWRDLERQSGRMLYVQTGSVWAAHGEDHVAVPSAMARVFVSEDPRAFIERSHKTMTALGVPNEVLDGPAYQRRFPQFASTGVVAALLDINSGSLFAREAVQALGDVGRRFGVTIHGGKRAVEVAPESAQCGVRFSDGTSIAADVVVLAINGWLMDVLPEFPTLAITEAARLSPAHRVAQTAGSQRVCVAPAGTRPRRCKRRQRTSPVRCVCRQDWLSLIGEHAVGSNPGCSSPKRRNPWSKSHRSAAKQVL